MTPESAIGEAFQSLFGAGFAVLLSSILGGVVVSFASDAAESSSTNWEILAMVWVGHWSMAGIMIWGLFAALIPIWCFVSLIHGTQPVGQVLGISFSTQLFISTFAVWSLENGGNVFRAIIVSTGLLFLIWCRPVLRECLGRKQDI